MRILLPHLKSAKTRSDVTRGRVVHFNHRKTMDCNDCSDAEEISNVSSHHSHTIMSLLFGQESRDRPGLGRTTVRGHKLS